MTKIVPGGWKVDDDGTHEIYLPPIIESCLQLIFCGSKIKCRTAACKCYKSEQVCSLPHVSATQTAASIFTQETLMNTWMMDHTAVQTLMNSWVTQNDSIWTWIVYTCMQTKCDNMIKNFECVNLTENRNFLN